MRNVILQTDGGALGSVTGWLQNLTPAESAVLALAVGLGLGVGGRIAGSIALRQGGKFIPIYGQTVGAAAASAFTFGATYALGRTAARYLYALSIGETPTREDMQATFRDAFYRTRSHDR